VVKTIAVLDGNTISGIIGCLSRYGRLLAGIGYKYYDTQAWATLKKCWKVFIIAKSQGDEDKLWYAKGIMKFQKQLALGVRPFPDLGL
jgi:hypothetical protein